jgi:hypothetical protein
MKKDQTYLAVNLSDFHHNQNGDARTFAEIRFIGAKNIEAAKALIHKLSPGEAWGVIPKRTMDQNIATKNSEMECA